MLTLFSANQLLGLSLGAPEEIRTPDPQIRRLVTDWRTKVQGAAGDL